MKTKPSIHLGKLAALAALPLLASTSGLLAQSNWIGTGGNATNRSLWSNASLWTGTVPTNNSSIALVFNNASLDNSANSFATNDLTGLTITSISVPATFGGNGVRDNTVNGNAITLSGNYSAATGNWQAFEMNIALASGAGNFSQTTGQTTFSGQISGSQNISKTGGGTIVFSGNNNFSGNVTVSGGALSVTNNNALGTTAGKTTANGGRVDLSNNITITGERIDLAGNGGNNELGVFRNVSGNNTWTGNVVTVGNDARIVATAGNLTISGVISSDNPTNNQVVFRSEGGTINLTNSNNFVGNTRVFGGLATGTGLTTNIPVLRLTGGDNRLPTTTAIDISGGNATILTTVELNNTSQLVSGIISSNTFYRFLGVGNSTLTVNDTNSRTVTGSLVESLRFVKEGSGTYTLSGNNTYTRGTTVNSGILRAGSTTAFGTNSAVVLANTEGVALDLNNFSNSIGSLTGGGALGGNVTLGSATLTVGGDNTSPNAYAGVISGTGGVTKVGNGVLTLAGSNLYSGATLVNAGTLLVNGSTSSSSAVTVGAAGTLGGNGTIGGATVVNGNLNPGNSPGILTVANSLTLNGTTTMEVNGISTRGTDFDGVDVTSGGVMTFGGALVFSFGNISALSNTTDINLFSFAGASAGNFSGVTSTGFYAGTWSVGVPDNTWTLTSGGQTLTFSEVTGNLTVIPEPSTLALVGLAGLVGFLRSRRSAKRS